MDIELIKQKLARVGLPLHGTDDELFARAIANGLVPGITAQEVINAPMVEVLDDGFVRSIVTSPEYKEAEDIKNRRAEAAVDQVKRGRPKKGK